jgi:hypothetical protein
MGRGILFCVSIFALVAAVVLFGAAGSTAGDKRVLRIAASTLGVAQDDCEARMQRLEASQAEGEERLAEKQAVIESCLNQYKHDKMIVRLVMDCARYEEQSVVGRQLVAECQLAAFSYANALRTLREEYRR